MNYLNKLLEALEKGQLQKGFAEVNICHDSWCALLNGKGTCNCNPDIIPIEPKKKESK